MKEMTHSASMKSGISLIQAGRACLVYVGDGSIFTSSDSNHPLFLLGQAVGFDFGTLFQIPIFSEHLRLC